MMYAMVRLMLSLVGNNCPLSDDFLVDYAVNLASRDIGTYVLDYSGRVERGFGGASIILTHPNLYIDSHIVYELDCNSLYFSKVFPY